MFNNVQQPTTSGLLTLEDLAGKLVVVRVGKPRKHQKLLTVCLWDTEPNHCGWLEVSIVDELFLHVWVLCNQTW